VGKELCFGLSYDHILIFQRKFNAIYGYINEKTVQRVTSVRQLNWKAHSQTGKHDQSITTGSKTHSLLV